MGYAQNTESEPLKMKWVYKASIHVLQINVYMYVCTCAADTVQIDCMKYNKYCRPIQTIQTPTQLIKFVE